MRAHADRRAMLPEPAARKRPVGVKSSALSSAMASSSRFTLAPQASERTFGGDPARWDCLQASAPCGRPPPEAVRPAIMLGKAQGTRAGKATTHRREPGIAKAAGRIKSPPGHADAGPG
jgi:hypothetical protein